MASFWSKLKIDYLYEYSLPIRYKLLKAKNNYGIPVGYLNQLYKTIKNLM